MLQMKVYGDLVLREKCIPVSNVSDDIKSKLNKMVEIMESKNGVGLAAPQVGLTGRFLVMKNPDTDKIIKIINPEIISRSDKFCVLEEGCLSVLGNDDLPVYSDVVRSETVVVKWLDENGHEQQAEMKDMAARIIQHETDHLDGVLFIDHLPAVKRTMLIRKLKKHKVKVA